MIDFIFMLTRNDRTVDDAMEVLQAVKDTGLEYIGFKDVGATPERQRELTQAAHDAGMTVCLEVVSTSLEDEMASLDAAVAAGVDWVYGGTNPEQGLERLAGSNIKYAPFPGTIVGHPSLLEGTIEEIAEHAAKLTAMEGVAGVDLLAYRHQSVDVLELTRAVVEASSGPVIAAGSVVREEQIKGLAAAGAKGFTIGGAIFDGLLPGDKDVVSQVRTALRMAS